MLGIFRRVSCCIKHLISQTPISLEAGLQVEPAPAFITIEGLPRSLFLSDAALFRGSRVSLLFLPDGPQKKPGLNTPFRAFRALP